MFISFLNKYKYYIISIALILIFLLSSLAHFLVFKTFIGPMLGYTYGFKIGINYESNYKTIDESGNDAFKDSTRKNEYLFALNSPDTPKPGRNEDREKEFYNANIQEKFYIPTFTKQSGDRLSINLKGNLNNYFYYVAHNGKTGFTPFNTRKEYTQITKLDCRAIVTEIGNVVQVIFRGYEDQNKDLNPNSIDVSCDLSNLPKGRYYIDYYDLNIVNYQNLANLNQAKIPENYWLSTFEVK